jgi:hypothetical protein
MIATTDPIQQFFAMFGRANSALWPMLIVWYLAAIGAVILALLGRGLASRLIAGFLAAYYVWVGVVFHAIYYRTLNPHALAFAALFVVGGLLFLRAGVLHTDLALQPRWEPLAVLGGVFMLYALAIYPLLGMLAGHVFPAAPLFGFAPCPTTIFTFGLLLWSRPRVPIDVLVIPLVWAMIATRGALASGVLEDVVMPIAALTGTALLVWRDWPAAWPRVLAGVLLAVGLALYVLSQDIILMALGVLFLIVAFVRGYRHRETGAAVPLAATGGRGPVPAA